MPVFNEKGTVLQAIKQTLTADIGKLTKELIVIDDGSNDGTAELLRNIKDKRVRLFTHQLNRGKGAAIRTGLKAVNGQVLIIQDADLEYDPGEYSLLLAPIISGRADVVYGSRFLGSGPHRVLYFWHMVGNKLLTLISNMLTNLNLTDMNVCYKAFTADIAKKIQLRENGFGFDPEFTAKVAKLNCRIYEVGISYFGRKYTEGKKISWLDGFRHLYSMFRYNL